MAPNPRDDVVLRCESLSKRYELGALSNILLTERLGGLLRVPGRRSSSDTGGEKSRPTPFWALRELDLEVRKGETLGVIGRNGAGKSTLLKVVSGITPPTSGRVVVNGRVATLLEVGTGFHPELSGRENIFLNGSILGMRRKEISRKYDEIVEFAGIERFLETPVKRYSSGMYVRLAFAVAAHLEPEILMVDEVLAVGDGEFQRKCLGKMHEVAGEGRTVIFISHDLGAIRRLCRRAVLLESGSKITEGGPDEVIGAYLSRTMPDQASGRAHLPAGTPRNGTGEARLVEVGMTSLDGESLPALHLGRPFRVTAVFDVGEEITDAVVEIGISTFGGERVATVQTIDYDRPLLHFAQGWREISVEIDTTVLPGEFAIDVALHHITGITVDHVQGILRFTALNAAEEGEDHYPWTVVRGYLRPRSRWSAIAETSAVESVVR